MTVFYVFLAVTLIFLLALVTRRMSVRRVCALCLSISLTWLGLLVLYKIDLFDNPILLALLMGQSVTGIFYLLKARLPKSLQIFTLPFFLSLTAVFYMAITNEYILSTLLLIAGLWLVAWFIFATRNDPGTRPLAKVVMECCEGEK